MKGHENKKKYPIPITDHGHGEKCMLCVVARIYIVGSFVVLERGVRVRRNCNISNHVMENVLKGLPDKISCPDIIHKCISNVHIFLITFKLRDRGDEIGFSGGRSRSTRREPPTMGKQLVNFITCGCESNAPFL